MLWSETPVEPSSRTLRQFAVLCLLFFSGMAAWQWWVRERGLVALALVGLALGLGVGGLLSPRLARFVFVGWMRLTFPLAWLVSNVLLACLFYGVFTPLGVVFRLAGRDSLGLRLRPGRESYWLPRTTPADVRSYFRQS